MDKFKRMGADKQAKWKCDGCVEESSSHSSQTSATGRGDENIILKHMETMQKTITAEITAQISKVDQNVNSLRTDIIALKSTLEEANTKIAHLDEENDTRKAEVADLKRENAGLIDEVNDLKNQIQDLQQYSRINNLEIAGIPSTQGEDVYDILSRLAGIINVPFSRNQISVAHRLPLRTNAQKNEHRKIVVCFASRSEKNAWRHAARARRNITAAEFCNTWPTTNVYINEHLTVGNKAVLGHARRLRKQQKIYSVWTTDCKIFVKKTAEDRSIRVWTTADLDALVSRD